MRRSSVIRKYLLSVGLAAGAILANVSVGHGQAQATSTQSSVDQDIALLRKDIRSDKKQIIAANLQLTDAEAQKFWPVYDQYTAELAKINDTKVATIKDYAANYSTLTDDKALTLTRQMIAIDESVGQLRLKYVPIFSKVISGKKTALFFQIGPPAYDVGRSTGGVGDPHGRAVRGPFAVYSAFVLSKCSLTLR